MIRVFKFKDVLGVDTYEYSCWHCCAAIRWPVSAGKLSPFQCMSCAEKQPDVSALMKSESTRMLYHAGGKGNILCGSLGQM